MPVIETLGGDLVVYLKLSEKATVLCKWHSFAVFIAYFGFYVFF